MGNSVETKLPVLRVTKRRVSAYVWATHMGDFKVSEKQLERIGRRVEDTFGLIDENKIAQTQFILRVGEIAANKRRRRLT